MKKKVVLAYSGDLDTMVIIPWLKENQDCDVTAVCVDIGQVVDFKLIKKRAMSAGAVDCQIIDAKKEFIEQYFFPALKAGAIYQDKYFLGIPCAYPLIAKTVADFAKTEKAAAIAHGAAGIGNALTQLTLGFAAVAPKHEIITPWLIWKLKNKKDLLRYLTRRSLALPEKKTNSYTTNSNLVSVSHEGFEPQELLTEVQFKKLLSMTVLPEKAPGKPEHIEIEFEKGVPVSINNKKMEGAALVQQLNKIGGANGIGITDLVENRITGAKIRSINETPGYSILYYARQQLEQICLDKESYKFGQLVTIKMGEIIYSGQWFTPLREALSGFSDIIQKSVNGKVKLKLYKGSISAVTVSSPNSLIVQCPAEEEPVKQVKKSTAGKTKTASSKPKAASKTTKKK
jgi:argininosuccinate synthase